MADTSRPRLYLIDGYSNIFRAFYAIRDLSSSKGEPTNAVYGFVQMLRKLLRDENPQYLGVAMDTSGPTVRDEMYEDYKAHRRPMPEDLRPQIPWIRKALDAYRIPILEYPRYEADDVLGTVARKAEAEGYDVVLVSPDKDLMQLVSEHVSMYHTSRDKLYDPALVEEDFGVPPERVADVLALMGDASDNVPGVPGIGKVGARKLVTEYGTVEEILDRAEEITAKRQRENLLEHADDARKSKQLVTIFTDLDVPFDPEALVHDPPDQDALRELFTELEFYSLAEELGPREDDEEIPAAEEITDPAVWRERMAVLDLDSLDRAGQGSEIAVAALGPGGEDAEPEGLAVATGDGVLYADFRRDGMREAALDTLAGWAESDTAALLGHDLKEVLRPALRHRGFPARGEPFRCRGGLFDLMLVSYLCKPSVHGHSLEELALERRARKALTAKDAGWEKGQQPSLGDDRLLALAGERAALLPKLAEGMRKDLGEEELARVYHDIEVPLLPVLLAMEERGIELDVGYLEEMSVELAREIGDLEEEIYDIADERFNINSPSQLGEILFDKLGYPVIKRTRKTKSASTGADVLEELAARGYPLPERLLRYRELTKLKSTYVDALPALVAGDGRVHTRFNQAVAATGRLSSTHPNLQNIPVRTELGQRIRRAFVAPEGRVLLVADYSQIELRVLAHIAEEEALRKAFREGGDIHRATAATVFDVAPELVSPEQRRAAKVINFGIVYGMSAFGLSQNLHIRPKEAERFIQAYLQRYAGVKRYMDETLEAAQKEGKVETLYGRVRYLPDIRSKNWNLRENAKRMAINARIQGTAADLMKIAMIRVADRLRDEAPGSELLLTVHDELVLEVPEDEVETVAGQVTAEMEGVAELAVPLVVDVGWGKSWYEAKTE